MALLNATRAAERLRVSRRALGRKAPHLEASGNAVRVGNRLMFESQGLEAAYAAVTEVQISNAQQAEAMAQQEAEADAAAGKIPPYGVSKAKREHFLALLAQRQLEQLEGTLVLGEDVKRVFFEEARRSRDFLLNLPNRISAELFAAKTSGELAIRLEREIHSCLVELSNGVEYKLSKLAEGTNA